MENQSDQADLRECYRCIVAALEAMSTEQLYMHLHEVRWILEQLGTIMPNSEMPYPEVYKQASSMVLQVDAMQEILTLEIARRAFASLQAMITTLDHGDTIMQMVAELGGMPDSPEISQGNNDPAADAE